MDRFLDYPGPTWQLPDGFVEPPAAITTDPLLDSSSYLDPFGSPANHTEQTVIRNAAIRSAEQDARDIINPETEGGEQMFSAYRSTPVHTGQSLPPNQDSYSHAQWHEPANTFIQTPHDWTPGVLPGSVVSGQPAWMPASQNYNHFQGYYHPPNLSLRHANMPQSFYDPAVQAFLYEFAVYLGWCPAPPLVPVAWQTDYYHSHGETSTYVGTNAASPPGSGQAADPVVERRETRQNWGKRCQRCAKRKVHCNGEPPNACYNCRNKPDSCTYPPVIRRRSQTIRSYPLASHVEYAADSAQSFAT